MTRYIFIDEANGHPLGEATATTALEACRALDTSASEDIGRAPFGGRTGYTAYEAPADWHWRQYTNAPVTTAINAILDLPFATRIVRT